MDLISVIVPVYKAEKYLCKCVDSILAQTYTNLEIILVDDGSPDNCGKICDEYALNDSRVKVIHKENGGVSSARNAGLKAFTGEYLTFVDSDDFIEKTYVETLANNMDNNTDIVICMYRTVLTDQKQIENNLAYKSITSIRIDDTFDFVEKTVNHVIYCKLFRKEVLKGLLFSEGICFGEDTLFCAQAFIKSKSIKYIPDFLYNYIVYKESLSHGEITYNKTTLLGAWEKITQLFPEESLSHKTCALKYLEHCFWIYGKTLLLNKNDKTINNNVFLIICSNQTSLIYKTAKKPFKIVLKYNLLIHFRNIYNTFLLIKEPLIKHYQ